MKIHNVTTIFLKEMLETIRDKRTLMVMVLGPVLIYPILILAFSQMQALEEAGLEKRKTTVYLHQKKEWPEIRKALSQEPNLKIVETPETSPPDDRDVLIVFDSRQAREQDVDVPRIVVTYRQTNIHSERGKERVLAAIDKYTREVTNREVELTKEERYLYPLIVEENNLSSDVEQVRSVLAMVLPMVLVLMTIAGAMYPAIDTTAGEKERGTIETILASPAQRNEIVYGKFLSVFVICMLTGLLNLTAMSLTFVHVLRATSQTVLSITSVAFVLISLIPLAVLFSALMMAVSTYARTFREAQNYITPVYLLCLIPAMMSVQRGFELNDFLCLVPVINMSLFFREIMEGTYHARHILLVFVSTTVYAALALRGAVKLFRDENALFSLEKPFALFVRRRFLKAKTRPSLAEAFFLCAAVFILFYYASPALGGTSPTPSSFAWQTIVSQWLLLLLPVLLFAKYLKVDLHQTFNLRRFRPVHLLGAFLLFGGGFFLIMELSYLQRPLLPLPESLYDRISGAVAGEGFLLAVLAMAVSPAICEEMMFRGFLLSGMDKLSPWAKILLNGAIFGVFHVLLFRVLPTAFLGVVIAFLVVYCGSVFPGILFHFVHNFLGLVLIHYHRECQLSLKSIGLSRDAVRWLEGSAHLPWQLLVASAAVFLGGAALIWKFRISHRCVGAGAIVETVPQHEGGEEEIQRT